MQFATIPLAPYMTAWRIPVETSRSARRARPAIAAGAVFRAGVPDCGIALLLWRADPGDGILRLRDADRPALFFDLIGAALGGVIIVPLLRPLGPGGLTFVASALALIAAGLFRGRAGYATVAGVLAIA
jgi:hypothetical protein